MVSNALTEVECRKLAGLLDEQERARASRFRFAEDRRDFVAAHALKRALLGEATGKSPRSLCFETGPYGKPTLELDPGDPAIAFNMSHTRGCVVVAYGEANIGVDVESLARPVPEGVAESHFAPAERTELHRGPETDLAKRFYTIWTLKEAYMKATGFGMQLPLDSFAVALDPPRLVSGADVDRVPVWQFHVEQVASHYMAALAIGSEIPGEITVSSDAIEVAWLLDLAGAV